MRRIAREKNISIRVAIDLVDNDLLKHALVAWAHSPHLAKIKTQGGGTVTVASGEQTGIGGTSRRVTDDFYGFVFEPEPAEAVA
jgi:hypothetical protein